MRSPTCARRSAASSSSAAETSSARSLRLRPDEVFVAADSSAYARTREQLLSERFELTVVPGPAIVPPGELHPAGGDHYRVFTAYWKALGRNTATSAHRSRT